MSFDPINPPLVERIDNGIGVKFHQLPPSGKPDNPLYNRLEVLLNNRIGNQYRITKDDSHLEYQVKPRKGQEQFCDLTTAESEIKNFLYGLYADQTFTRYDGRKDFIKSKEVTVCIKKFFAGIEQGFHSKSGTSVQLTSGAHRLLVSWSFLRGDASKEFDFTWHLETTNYLDVHNSVRLSVGLKPSKTVRLFSVSQYYDKPKSIPRLYDVATEIEAIEATNDYISYLRSAILDQLREGLTYQSIMDLIQRRIDLSLSSRTDYDYYSRLLVLSQSEGEHRHLLHQNLTMNVKNPQVKQLIEQLAKKISSS